MAVEQLKKVTVICERDWQDQVLKSLQSLQKIQLENLFDQDLNKDWLAEYFPNRSPKGQHESGSTARQIKKIQDSILFITHNGEAKQKTPQLKRKNLDFKDLFADFNEDHLKVQLREIDTLIKAWDQNQQATKTQQEIADWANDWYSMDLGPYELGSNSVVTMMATLANEQWTAFSGEIYDLKNVHLESYATRSKETAFGLVFLRNMRKEVQGILQKYGGKEEHNPYGKKPQELLTTTKIELEKLVDERATLTNQIGQLKQQIPDLQLAEEYYLAKESREESKKGIVQDNYLVLIQGWLPQREQASLEQTINRDFPNGEIYLSYEDPTREEIDSNHLPIKLHNKSFIKPFEMLTEMYSVPKYEEIDPTPWMAPFYFVFFGMMVADAGYGALMLIVTTLALKVMTLGKGTARFMKLFQYLAIPTIIWGLIYGSAFGAELPFYLLSPSKDFMAIFGVSMVFAGIQLFTGLFLAAKENIKKKDYLAAINQGFSWQGILAGILIAAAGALVFQASAITVIGAILAIVSALLVVISSMLQSKSKVGGFFMGLYDLYGVTSYIGDFVSYSRLMALGISGGSIAAAFNMLVAYLPPVARFSAGIVLIVILQGLNIFLSLLSAYVHAARLQYVEFFGKFYEGGGKPFKAFKPAEKYVNFNEDEIGGKRK